MAAKTITMHQIRQILELNSQGKGFRDISRITGLARNTVRTYLVRIHRYSKDREYLFSLSDNELKELAIPSRANLVVEDEKYQILHLNKDYYLGELQKTGVTKQLLWREYRTIHSNGYGYTQFCKYLSDELKKRGVVMHFSHTPGEVMQIDFAGSTMNYIDKNSGEVINCQILVCVLPYSNLTYAIALRSQKQADFIAGINQAMVYIGGVPLCIKSDNLKSAITKPNRYEPTIAEAMDFFAQHYNTTMMAARAAKPRDKASVEKAVDLVYKNIYAPLRDHLFYSIEELNLAIARELEVFNSKKMYGKNYSRREIFESDERLKLKELPVEKYDVKHTVKAKVQKNYHIILGEDKKQYSVPFKYCGQIVKVIYTNHHVEIYLDHNRIALHKRNYTSNFYITNADHMPENHKAMHHQKGWDKDYFINQSQQIGECTHQVILKILEGHAFIEQSYNSCLGVLRLEKKYSKERLENACKRALKGKNINYRIISTILFNNQDKMEEESQQIELFNLPHHDQIRGASTYQ